MLAYALKYLKNIAERELFMDKYKSFINIEMFETLVKLLMVTHKEVTLFKEDPHEFE